MRMFAPAPLCLLLAAVSVGLLACGSVVVIEGEASGTSSPGSGGSGGEGGVTSSSSSSTGTEDPPPPSDECTTVCSPGGDAKHCACKRYCSDPNFGKPNAKITCAPLADMTTIQCVCTYGEDFSGVCFEKSDQLCSFDMGCCAKYFIGK